MRTWLQKNYRFVFYLLWLLLGLMQAGLTELQDDEAYYWVYSRFPAWGYFDHPPMIAILVKAGYALFPNEIGVRLFPLLLNVASLFLIEKLIDRKNPFLFFAIALSMAVIQLGGFMAVPDIPLIFFTALFFLCYRRLIRKQNPVNGLLLGLSIALLFYSKYHGILVVFFTVISNPRLLTRYHIWFAGAFALLLYTPHLWWQYQHDWISFRYHLFESNVKPYKISYTGDYLLGQLLMGGPLAGIILLPAAFLYRQKDYFDKALYYTMIGVYVFFLLSSFRGRVEANWTTPALIPVIILSHKYLEEKWKWRKILFRLLPVSIFLTLLGRIIMIEDILPVKNIRERYHAWTGWQYEMKTKTKGLPVVFGNYYQYASKYWFYTGQESFAQSFYKVRKNNFNFWPVEDSLLGKKVFVLDKHRLYLFPDSIKTPLGWIGYKYDSCFPSFAKLKINVAEKKLSIKQGEPILLHCTYDIPVNYRNFLSDNPVPPDTTVIGVFNKKGWLLDIPTPLKLSSIKENRPDTLNILPPLTKGRYILRFAIHVGKYYPAHSSENIKLTVN